MIREATGRARPKSVSLTLRGWPGAAWSMTTFSGLRSRWTIPCSWACCRAAHIWRAMAIVSPGNLAGVRPGFCPRLVPWRWRAYHLSLPHHRLGLCLGGLLAVVCADRRKRYRKHMKTILKQWRQHWHEFCFLVKRGNYQSRFILVVKYRVHQSISR